MKRQRSPVDRFHLNSVKFFLAVSPTHGARELISELSLHPNGNNGVLIITNDIYILLATLFTQFRFHFGFFSTERDI
jgi:hypothetical protein